MCNHTNCKDHYDNPRRFTCIDCGTMFMDYGKGYEEVRITLRPINTEEEIAAAVKDIVEAFKNHDKKKV